MKATLFFRSLKRWCAAGAWFYFKKWQVNNVSAIPKNGPVIFIPTHQNAFIDAVLVICSTPRNPWSIARASVFKKGFVTTLLTAIQIKPVFRIRDGWGSLRNNDAIMQEWTAMLGKGQDIIIFAEGNHNEPYARGTLQRGFTRMALQFQQQHTTPLTIVPVGVHYDDHSAFRSRVLVNFGDPIRVNDILHASLTEREKLDRLLTVTEDGLQKLALAIEPDESYHDKYTFLMKNRIVEVDMVKQLEQDQAVLRKFPMAAPPAQPREKGKMFWKVVNPIVWIGFILHYPPYALIRGFIRKKVKDPQFIASLKYAFGIFLVPIYYIILLIIFYAFIPSLPGMIAFGIALPLTGILATDILKK